MLRHETVLESIWRIREDAGKCTEKSGIDKELARGCRVNR